MYIHIDQTKRQQQQQQPAASVGRDNRAAAAALRQRKAGGLRVVDLVATSLMPTRPSTRPPACPPFQSMTTAAAGGADTAGSNFRCVSAPAIVVSIDIGNAPRPTTPPPSKGRTAKPAAKSVRMLLTPPYSPYFIQTVPAALVATYRRAKT